MLSGRSIAAFAVKFLVIYGALAASWPLCGRAYAFFLQESSKVLFEAVGARDKVRIRATTSPDGRNDTLIFVREGTSKDWFWIKDSSWQVGFLSTSMLVALTLATPLGWRRRLWAFVGGLVVVHLFVLVRVVVLVITGTIEGRGTFWDRVLTVSIREFTGGPSVSCFVPVLIWIAVTVRREDVRHLFTPTLKTMT